MDYELQAVPPGRTRTSFSPDELVARIGLCEADTDTLAATLLSAGYRRGVDILAERLGLLRRRTQRLRDEYLRASHGGGWAEVEPALRHELDAIGHSLTQLSVQLDHVLAAGEEEHDPPAALERESALLHAYLEELRLQAALAGKEARDIRHELAEAAATSLRAVIAKARDAVQKP